MVLPLRVGVTASVVSDMAVVLPFWTDQRESSRSSTDEDGNSPALGPRISRAEDRAASSWSSAREVRDSSTKSPS